MWLKKQEENLGILFKARLTMTYVKISLKEVSLFLNLLPILDIHEQEAAFKIRLLKRQNNQNKRLVLNNSFSVWSESDISKLTE